MPQPSDPQPTVGPVDPDDAVAGSLLLRAQAELEVRYPDGDISPSVAAELRPPHGVLLVAEAGGVAVGCVGVLLDGRVAEMRRLFVPREARRGGVGSALVAAAEDWAVQRRADVLRLETGLAHPEAIALYELRGYRRVPCWPPYDTWPRSLCFARHLRL